MLKINTQRRIAILMMFSAYAAILLLFRIFYTGKMTYTFLAWNLFLAWIPLGFALLVNQSKAVARRGWLLVALLGAWLIFLPNAPYILTDLVHLRPRRGIPFWFDMMLILSFAWAGLMLCLVSVREIHAYLERKFRPAVAWFLVGGALVAASFGVYIGRYLRWNSWDILQQPAALMDDLLAPVLHPGAHKETIGMTIALSGFLFLVYLSMRMFGEPTTLIKQNDEASTPL